MTRWFLTLLVLLCATSCVLDLDPKGEDPGLNEAAEVPPFSTTPGNAGGFTDDTGYESTGDETGYPDPALPAEDETAGSTLAGDAGDAGDAVAVNVSIDAGVDAGPEPDAALDDATLDDAGTDNSASPTKIESDPQADPDSGTDGGSQDEPQADGGAP